MLSFALHRIHLPIAAVALAAFAAPNLLAQSQYTVDPIEAPPGFALYPSAINNDGFVVGWWYGSPVTNRQPFIYSQATGYNLLPKPPGHEFSVPMDINDAGVIVGYASPTWEAWDPRGWKLQNGVFTMFPLHSHAVGINASDVIVGMSCKDAFDGSMDCVFISNEPPAMQSFSAVAGQSGSMDRGIVVNDLGQTAYRTGPTTAVFRDTDGTIITLPPPTAPWTGIRVEGINNDGQVIARWTRSSTLSGSIKRYSLGFVWSATTGAQEFGITAGSVRPKGMNNDGQIVIESGTHDQAFFDVWVWSPQTGAVNLDNTTDYGNNLVLTDLYDINDAGQIVAGGDTISPSADIYVVLNPPAPPAVPGDITGDGQVGVDDLLSIINSWGVCENPANCPADIAPAPGGDGAVNVDDLLMVINNWS